MGLLPVGINRTGELIGKGVWLRDPLRVKPTPEPDGMAVSGGLVMFLLVVAGWPDSDVLGEELSAKLVAEVEEGIFMGWDCVARCFIADLIRGGDKGSWMDVDGFFGGGCILSRLGFCAEGGEATADCCWGEAGVWEERCRAGEDMDAPRREGVMKLVKPATLSPSCLLYGVGDGDIGDSGGFTGRLLRRKPTFDSSLRNMLTSSFLSWNGSAPDLDLSFSLPLPDVLVVA
jgi:hypothetical protein